MRQETSTRAPLRRAQLIAPFGVGAMVVVRDGSSLISAGLDHWYQSFEEDAGKVEQEEYMIEEWRLEKELGVSHFRLPPDYREPRKYGAPAPNERLTVPFLRFPTWHYCTWCHHMEQLTLTTQGRAYCKHCRTTDKKARRLVQVPVIALCEDGHIQDFPWREWVHRSQRPTCNGTLKLRSTGGATLAAQRVECTECGAGRTLAQVMGGPLLITGTESEAAFTCSGQRPWLGEGGKAVDTCGRELRASLRSASNVYFAQTKSAIYLPRGTHEVPQALMDVLTSPKPRAMIHALGDKITPELLRGVFRTELESFRGDAIRHAIDIMTNGEQQKSAAEEDESEERETRFRRAEFEVLSSECQEDRLAIRAQPLLSYDPAVSSNFSKIMLVDKLRETRALVGFTRIHAEAKPTTELKALLRRNELPPDQDWLPAYTVFGEGIFLEVDENRLQSWEARSDVRCRIEPLQNRYRDLQKKRHTRDREISPRFVLLHTLGHLIMNRLTFECGYSSASLRERLYVSANSDKPMAGILVYTAAGDSEGTMGGLVRMGKPGIFEPMLMRALQAARWCSADPVCMEMGGSSGQGPNSLNLAACHNCGLVPETACEEFNAFLDRGLVIGEPGNQNLGFFCLS